jgi:DprA/Smf-like nucleotide binding protein involved in DNA uptake
LTPRRKAGAGGVGGDQVGRQVWLGCFAVDEYHAAAAGGVGGDQVPQQHRLADARHAGHRQRPSAAASPAGTPPAGGPGPVRAGSQARKVLAALVDGGVLGAPRLAALTGLEPAALAAALLELELAGLVRRTAGGVQTVVVPGDARPEGA